MNGNDRDPTRFQKLWRQVRNVSEIEYQRRVERHMLTALWLVDAMASEECPDDYPKPLSPNNNTDALEAVYRYICGC